jgi:hypothetical protein
MFTVRIRELHVRTRNPKILQPCLFTVPQSWKVDSSIKITLSRKRLSWMRSNVSTANSFPWRPSSGSSVCTIWILHACSFIRGCRIFCGVERRTCSSVLGELCISTGCAEKLPGSFYWRPACALLIAGHYLSLETFQPSLDGLSSRCFFCLFRKVASLHLNNWFCLSLTQRRHCSLLGGETAILHSSAVYDSTAPLSAGQSINVKSFQRFFRTTQSISRYL